MLPCLHLKPPMCAFTLKPQVCQTSQDGLHQPITLKQSDPLPQSEAEPMALDSLRTLAAFHLVHSRRAHPVKAAQRPQGLALTATTQYARSCGARRLLGLPRMITAFLYWLSAFRRLAREPPRGADGQGGCEHGAKATTWPQPSAANDRAGRGRHPSRAAPNFGAWATDITLNYRRPAQIISALCQHS